MFLWVSEYEQLTNIHFTLSFSDPDMLIVRVLLVVLTLRFTKTDGRLHAYIG